MCKGPVAGGWGGESCDAEAWELRVRQLAGKEERAGLSTPRPARDASHGGKPSAFHTRKMTGSPPHFRLFYSYSVGTLAEGVGARGEASWEAPAACGPGDREGSKVDHPEVSEEWPREAAPIERLGSWVGQDRGRGAEGGELASSTGGRPGQSPQGGRNGQTPATWPKSGRPSQLAVINLYPSPPSPGR